MILDVVGMIPIVGNIADGANAVLYTIMGDYINAGISVAAAIPFTGLLAGGGRNAARVVDAATGVTRAGVRGVDAASSVGRALTPAEAARIIPTAERVGTAARHTDTFHRAPSFLTEADLARGRTSVPNSGDGIIRTRLEVTGEVNGNRGIFEFIIEPNNTVSHQVFRPTR